MWGRVKTSDDAMMKDADLCDRNLSIPVSHCHPAPTTSKDTCDINPETNSESGRKSSKDRELDNENPHESDLQHLDKASLKEKMSSEVCSLQLIVVSLYINFKNITGKIKVLLTQTLTQTYMLWTLSILKTIRIVYSLINQAQ